MENKEATLFVVSTPIGNIKDITIRALELFKNIDIIICEDTRRAKKLFNLLEISIKGKTFLSYYKGKERVRVDRIIEKIKGKGEAILLSDAGTPLISDPGEILIKEVLKKGINVVSIPGASSILAAITSSGISIANGFIFLGFLPSKKDKLKRVLKKYLNLPLSLIFFESPERVKKTLELISQLFSDRKVSVCRELTKLHEEIIRGKAKDVYKRIKDRELRGEFVIVVEGLSRERSPKTFEEIKTFLLSTTTLTEKKLMKILEGESRKDRGL